MSTLAVIPARLGATRLPRKPLRLLGGAPLILRVWEHTAAMGSADRVVVATDSPEVAHVCSAGGAEVVMTSPVHESGTERVAEVAALPAYRTFDIIVNVQGDEPFVPAQALHGALGLVEGAGFALGTAAAAVAPERVDAVLAAPNIVKVVVGDDGRALYFSRAPVPYRRDAADRDLHAGLVRQHIGVYACRRDALARWVGLPRHPLEVSERLEQLRPLAAGIPMGVATIASLAEGGIDTEDDLALANARWQTRIEEVS